MRKLFAAIFVWSLCILPAFAEVSYPEPTGYVNDLYGALSDQEQTLLENRLKTFEAETSIEIAILIIGTTGGVPINDYAISLGNYWGVGKDNRDNGIVMVAAMDDRDFFMATGRQTEIYISDGLAGYIFRNYIRPEFKNGNYFAGLSTGIDQTIAALEGKDFSELMANESSSDMDAGEFAALGIVLLSIFMWLAAILGRSKRVWPGAVIGGIGGFWLLITAGSPLGGAIFGGIFCAVLGLIFDSIVSGAYDKSVSSGGSPPWWSGGGSSSGSSGGGFGGFGGGSFGGGGGGGSW